MGCFTKHVGKSTCLRKISTCFSGFFSGQVGAQIDDIESRKVKRYLFSNLHFFAFLGNVKVVIAWQCIARCLWACGSAEMEIKMMPYQ